MEITYIADINIIMTTMDQRKRHININTLRTSESF